MEAFEKAEKIHKPHWKNMFTDVYDEMPSRLKQQMDHMEKMIKAYPDKYPMEMFAKTPDPIIKK